MKYIPHTSYQFDIDIDFKVWRLLPTIEINGYSARLKFQFLFITISLHEIVNWPDGYPPPPDDDD